MKDKLNVNWINALASVGVEFDWQRLQQLLQAERLRFSCYPAEGN